MAMRKYSSTDAGAPALSDVNGSFIALLTAVLVGTSGVAYGSKPSAGWTNPFTGTNLAVFKQGAGGHDRFIRVSDGGKVGTNRRILSRGYEAMSAISTGTGPYPTSAQINGDGQYFQYLTSDATTPPIWTVYANSNTFYVLVNRIGTGSAGNEFFGFGTGVSRKQDDSYFDFHWSGQNLTTAYSCGMQYTATNELFIARSDTGAIGAKPGTMYSDGAPYNGRSYLGQDTGSVMAYPDRVTGGLLMSRPGVMVDGYIRGKLPGVWEAHHNASDLGGNGTTFTGTGALAGRGFDFYTAIAPNFYGAANPIIENTDTWDV